MQNGIFKLDWASIGEAVLTAVVFAILGGFVTIVAGGDFNIFTANWPLIGQNMANLGFVAGVVSLGKDILSTNNGSLLGITPPTT
jgi:hypothetical protein